MIIKIKILFITGLLLAACQNPNNSSKVPVSDSLMTKVADPANIPYKVVEHYFLKNTVTNPAVLTKITSKEAFEKTFGAATTMKDPPTPVDFEREYIVAIIKPETDTASLLVPVSLQRNASNNMIFSYINRKADRQSFTIRPVLLIAVDKTEEGDIELSEH